MASVPGVLSVSAAHKQNLLVTWSPVLADVVLLFCVMELTVFWGSWLLQWGVRFLLFVPWHLVSPLVFHIALEELWASGRAVSIRSRDRDCGRFLAASQAGGWVCSTVTGLALQDLCCSLITLTLRLNWFTVFQIMLCLPSLLIYNSRCHFAVGHSPGLALLMRPLRAPSCISESHSVNMHLDVLGDTCVNSEELSLSTLHIWGLGKQCIFQSHSISGQGWRNRILVLFFQGVLKPCHSLVW